MPTATTTQNASKLTAKQTAFVDEYLVDLNATQAAIRAGYSQKTAKAIGTENLSKPAIALAIQKAMAARAERTELSQDYVLSGILDTVERCKQARPVLDRRGNPVMVETPQGEMTPAYTFDPSPALRGYELLGKHLGMFGEREEAESRDNLADALRTHARALPVAKSRPLPIAQVQQREDIEDAVIVDGEVQP